VETTTHEKNFFELMKGYDGNDDGLRRFKDDLVQWSAELMSNRTLKINYLKYFNHMNACEMTFKRLCKGKYEEFETIDSLESSWIENCHNGGLTYCEKGTHQSHGHDFSSFYPNIMGEYKFKMPVKCGTERILKVLPTNLELGFYRVKISSDHKHATKVFAFSPNHTYTSTSLEYAINLSEDRGVHFNIELIVDGSPNAYIYTEFVRGHAVFDNWLGKLYDIKQVFPKNKLIKHLLSSLHGSLSRSNSVYKTAEDIESEGLDVSMGNSSEYKIIDYRSYSTEYLHYKLQSNRNPYRYNFRLKSFLSSYGRTKIAEVALQKIDKVIYIHTDGIAFCEDIRLNFPFLVRDKGTTGLIKYNHVNSHTGLGLDITKVASSHPP
jgi:hypothetical protein